MSSATAGAFDPYWGDAVRREPDYRSPEYPGHADQRKAA